MKTEPKDFEKLISKFPAELKTLEVGVWGHEGVNTSKLLIERFPDYLGMNIREEKKRECQETFPKAIILNADYYKWKFTTLWDLIVLDLNIENNLKDWSDEQLERVHKILMPGGFVINYIMMTDQYGDPETPALIREHRDRFWGVSVWDAEAIFRKLGNIKGFQYFAHQREERRPYIYWVVLQKI